MFKHGKINKHSAWQHTVVRFEQLGGGYYSKEEIKKQTEKFARGWQKIQAKSVNFSLLVFHGYPKEQEANKVKCPHLHILWKYYKGSHLKAAIEEFIERYNLKHAFFDCDNVYYLAKYLLQGEGRKVLFQKGECSKTEVYGGSNVIRSQQEVNLCENHLFEERPEKRKGGGQRNQRLDHGPSGPREASNVPEVVMMRKLEDLFMKHRVKDEQNLSQELEGDDKDWFDMCQTKVKDWNKIFLAARTNVMTSLKKKSWEEIMESLPDDPKEFHVNCMSVNKSVKILQKVLDRQGLGKEERLQFLRNVYAVMNNNIKGKKRNTLYLIGAVSAGKTWITRSLEQSVIFSFTTGEYNARSSDFHFEDMCFARIASIEEPQIESGKVDKFKVIFEGGSFDTNVKFKVKGRVKGVPVIVSSNNEVYRFAPEAKEAFDERWYRWDFKQSVGDVGITGCAHPKMWLKLIKHYGLDLTTIDDDSSDSEVDFDEFGGHATIKPGLKRGLERDLTDQEDSDDGEGSNPEHPSCRKRLRFESSSESEFGSGDSLLGDIEDTTGAEVITLDEEAARTVDAPAETKEERATVPDLKEYLQSISQGIYLCTCGTVWDGNAQCPCGGPIAPLPDSKWEDINEACATVPAGTSFVINGKSCMVSDPNEMRLAEMYATFKYVKEVEGHSMIKPNFYFIE